MKVDEITWSIDVFLIENNFIKKKAILILSLEFITVLIIIGIIFLFNLYTLRLPVFILLFIYILLLSSILINCNTKHTLTYSLENNRTRYSIKKENCNNLFVNLISSIPSPYKKFNFLESIRWKNVRNITLYRYDNTIILRNKFGQKFIIFANENNFDFINLFVQEKCPRIYPILK